MSPSGNTSSADPAGASESVRLSGAIPGYSMRVGDTPTNGDALWSCRSGQPVSLEPEIEIVSGDGRLAAIIPNPQDRCLEEELNSLSPLDSVNMGNSLRVDPTGNTTRHCDPADAPSDVRLSGENPGYSVKVTPIRPELSVNMGTGSRVDPPGNTTRVGDPAGASMAVASDSLVKAQDVP